MGSFNGEVPIVPWGKYLARDWELQLSYPGLKFKITLAGTVEEFRECVLDNLDNLHASVKDAIVVREKLQERMLPHATRLMDSNGDLA